MILNELKRVITSKKFIIVIFIGLLIASVSVYIDIKQYIFFNYDAPDIQTPELQEKVKAMVESGLNKYSVFFSSFLMSIVTMPILSILPFGLSYIEDREYGIIKQIDMRIKHKKYILSKLLVNGIAGGLAIIIPTIILSILIFTFLKGDISGFYGYGKIGGPFAKLLTENFSLYIVIHIFINFVLGFAYASIGLAVSAFIKNKIAIILSPFLFWILGSIFCSVLNIYNYSPSAISQFYRSADITISNIFIEIIFIIVLFSALFLSKTRKDHIYEQ
jgi:ABC-type transport system involved in multi-copper enzyme maturation permease subunit